MSHIFFLFILLFSFYRLKATLQHNATNLCHRINSIDQITFRSGQPHGSGQPHAISFPKNIEHPFKVLSYSSVEEAKGWMHDDNSNWDLIRWELQRKNQSDPAKLNCVDIGGNHGFYSLFMASYGCIVDYFEIQSKLVALAFNSSYYNNLQGKINIHHVGISDAHATVSYIGGDGGAFLNHSTSIGEVISVFPAEDCINHKKHITIAKIDVEGFEMRVLRGMAKHIQKGRVETLLIEIGPSRWKRALLNFDEGYSILHDTLGKLSASVVVRGTGSCVVDKFSNQTSEDIALSNNEVLREIPWDHMKDLLYQLNVKEHDCNFWFTKHGSMSKLIKAHPIRIL